MEKQIKIALAGNPNSGKTTLFNALTGSNQFVGNWPGVTVEKKEGKLKKHVSSFAQRKHSDLTFSEKTGFCFCLICIRIFPPLRESSLFFPRFFPGTASAAPVPLSFRRLFAWISAKIRKTFFCLDTPRAHCYHWN